MTTEFLTPGQVLESPHNSAAEWSVLSHMLSEPSYIAEVIGVPLEQADFSQPDTRLIYATAVERYYQSQPVDALIVGEMTREQLATLWSAEPASCAALLVRRVREAMVTGDPREHAHIVKRLSTSRQLMDCCYQAITKIHDGKLSPQEIGDQLSTDSLNVTAGSAKRSELLSWMDTGREYVRQLQRLIKAKQEGIEIGVYTGMPFIDDYTTGIAPGELCFLAGEPGVGKTAVAWAAAMGFASKQLLKAPERRVGTLMVSLEMNVYSSTARVVSALTGIDSVRLREGAIAPDEFEHLLREWKARSELPLYFNFASNFRTSQLRALIAEAIRKANVGFIVIDHFRMLDTDRIYSNPNQEDEAKVRFLKESVAKDLGVAVMCLAHTSKVGRGQGGESARPRLADLRGSGMIAAHADFVSFLWSPFKYMSDEARTEWDPRPGDLEVLEIDWAKNRYGKSESAHLQFDAKTMRVRPA